MHLGTDYKFPWAERSAVLVTQAQYTTGTCTATQGSTTLTGSGTAWNTANAFSVNNMRAGGKIKVGGGLNPYEIQSVSSDTAAVLASKYTEATATTSTYTYFEDAYALASDFLRPVDTQRFSDDVPIDLISRTEFRRRYPANSTPGRPSVACIVDSAPSGNTTLVRKVRFNQPPDTYYSIPYTYLTANLVVSSLELRRSTSADADEPIVPLRYRHAIVFHALYNWYRDKKDDQRMDAAKGEYTDVMLRVMSDVEVGGVRPQLRPRVSGYAMSARRPWSGGYRRFM
jgi:hypothetical protein